MPKLIKKPTKNMYVPPQRSPPVLTVTRKSRIKIPDLVLGQIQDIPDTVGFSCKVDKSSWVIVDRFSKVLEEQPIFAEHETARAYADALNEEIVRRRFK